MNTPALTSARLGEAWPEVSAKLRRMLASRGVDPALNDDIVQEVAVRALDKQVPFTDPADLYRWAATTARHLHIDHLRCDGRTTHDDALVTVADATDVAHTVERRVALGHVLRAMAGLRPGERAAILDSLEDREARTSQALVRRHRARATLRKAVGGAISAATLARLRLRTLSPAFQAAAAAAVVAPALVVGGGTLLSRPAPAAPDRPLAVAPAAPDGAVEDRGARTTRVAAAVAATSPRAARVAPPAVAPAPAPAEARPATPRRQLGPIDVEQPPRKGDDYRACVSNDHKPVWCAPTVQVRPRLPRPPVGPLGGPAPADR